MTTAWSTAMKRGTKMGNGRGRADWLHPIPMVMALAGGAKGRSSRGSISAVGSAARIILVRKGRQFFFLCEEIDGRRAGRRSARDGSSQRVKWSCD